MKNRIFQKLLVFCIAGLMLFSSLLVGCNQKDNGTQNTLGNAAKTEATEVKKEPGIIKIFFMLFANLQQFLAQRVRPLFGFR